MRAGLTKNWTLAQPDVRAEALAAALKISPLLGHLLVQRGIDEVDRAHEFLEPRLQSLGDPFLLTGLRAAAERIQAALERGERMVIYGDYDVDGITSSALLWRVLKQLGGSVETFLPHRIDEGYGLSQDGVERCCAELKPQLLVAVDCGTTAVSQIAWLKAQGVETVVIDHHSLPPELPVCHALVNPQQDGQLTYLCSVGLVFKVCHGLMKLRPVEQRLDLRDFLDLVAVGTVADIVPLKEENRIFVRAGLKHLRESKWVGLVALCEVAQIKRDPTPADVGFRIGPRLNASGRLDDATLSLNLLKTDSLSEAQRIARELDTHNRERQRIEQDTFDEALEMLEACYDPAQQRAIVLARRGWHVGVIGIVASRLQRMYHRPVFVIGINEEGMGKGSGRSIDGCSLIGGLTFATAHLELFGGHDMAAGLSVREENVEAFREALNQWVTEHVPEECFHPVLRLDAPLRVDQVRESLLQELDMLAPFGRDNPQPVFAIESLRHRRDPLRFGRNHIKFFPAGGAPDLEAVAFGMGERPSPTGDYAVAGIVERDDYRGGVQIRVLDWRE